MLDLLPSLEGWIRGNMGWLASYLLQIEVSIVTSSSHCESRGVLESYFSETVHSKEHILRFVIEFKELLYHYKTCDKGYEETNKLVL